jgi:hypothetical protein
MRFFFTNTLIFKDSNYSYILVNSEATLAGRNI